MEEESRGIEQAVPGGKVIRKPQKWARGTLSTALGDECRSWKYETDPWGFCSIVGYHSDRFEEGWIIECREFVLGP